VEEEENERKDPDEAVLYSLDLGGAPKALTLTLTLTLHARKCSLVVV